MAEKFFDEREDQSEVKARIVSKYFGAWAKIIGPISTAERIGYIDLFCGPGRYKDGSKSTPIMVLEQAVGDDVMRQRLVTIFNDQDPDHTKNLNDEIAKIAGAELPVLEIVSGTHIIADLTLELGKVVHDYLT